MKRMMAKSMRVHAPSLFSYSLRNHIAGKASGAVRFVQVVSGSNQSDASEKPEHHQSKSGETTSGSSSGGGGYAKRSDEAGYGAEYGGNKSLSPEDEDKIVHGNAPEYNKSKKSS